MSMAPLREVVATRYVLPLREGGSMPGLMEADDLGTYVVKFTGAGQGPKALVAEVVVAGLARVIGLRVPELVVVDVDPILGRAEPDPEVQDLLRASPGPNLGVDFLPGSLGFEPAADPVDPDLAAAVVWLDALVLNVDRSWRNPNLLCWHRELWLIDHGAALYPSHNWATASAVAAKPYAHAGDHVLLGRAASLVEADARLAPLVTAAVITDALAVVPDAWLQRDTEMGEPDAVRAAYGDLVAARMAARPAWVPELEAIRAGA